MLLKSRPLLSQQGKLGPCRDFLLFHLLCSYPDICSQVRTIERVCEIPHEGPFCDLMWSDPEDLETWSISPRGAGWLFGSKVTAEFNHINGLSLICRAHQLVQEGVKFMFEGTLLGS